jgi:hypothetical protein
LSASGSWWILYGVARRFELRFESVEDLAREIEANLRRGRTFVAGQLAPADRSACVVCVEHPQSGAVVELAGEVVFAQAEGPRPGVGVDLIDADLSQRLSELMASGDALEQAPAEISLDFAEEQVDLAPGEEEPESEDTRSSSRAPDSRRGVTVHEKVRKLTPPAREKLARTGSLAERVALERAFGASIWDGLLENGQITGAEIAKIAKNGMAPATTLSRIVANAGWLSKPEVRRALLANSRLPAALVERVLRSLPQAELRLVPSQAAYPPGVRATARRLLQH